SELSTYPETLGKLLYHRGIKTKVEAESFLNPSYDLALHDPFLIGGMERAVDRILLAIKGNQRIVVWSDYDHDGVPGGVVLREFFHAIEYKNFTNYIPHRYTEGYGLNTEGIETLAKDGASLIITVDCGITDVAPVAHAKELGVDVIITDHHLPAGDLPLAHTVLNSKQEHCEYPFPMLCGAAVAWKLVIALITRGEFRVPKGFEKWLLDLVGLSTIADMVPLVGENRILAHYGLLVLRKTRRPGLRALYKVLNLNPQFLTEDDVGFMLAPRLNAASRMAEPQIAFNLLASLEADAPALAKELDQLNSKRKGAVGALVREIKTILRDRRDTGPVLVAGNPEWRPGLLGLAATSVVEEFGKPVFLWGREGGEVLKGSCRSPNVDLVALMSAVKEGVFMEFGGHSASGGFSVFPDAVHYLADRLSEAHSSMPTFTEPQGEVLVDGTLPIKDVSESFWREISRLAPFGMGNPKPLFMIEGGKILESKSFGKEGQHLSLILQDEYGNKAKAIRFFMNDSRFSRSGIPEVGEDIKIVGTIEKSYFGRRPEVRLRIEDIL
ncbi:MAG: single-stranded-DNA-specific exonuclease RecJ, partial [Patescibacteria group bacterium]